MIKVAENVWIGNSHDESQSNLQALKITGVLNVAQDLHSTRGWLHGIEYCQVGLIDGPGNLLSAYCAAALALDVLARRRPTLVCCHSAGRSLAVAIMYLNLVTYRGWDEWLEILHERIDCPLPQVHSAHKEAFGKINWKSLGKDMGIQV